MSQQPAIDILFRAIVYKDPEAWNQVDARAAEFDSIRAIISTTNPGAIDLDLGLGIKSNKYVIPIFEGPRANFISRDTSVQAHLDAGRSRVLLDYSLSFDSNFAEKLRAVLNKEKVQEVEYKIVLDVLRLKTNNNNVQFDIMPFLYENLRLAREDKNNRRPINTLIAFNMLEYLDFHMLIDNQIDQCFKVNKDFLI